MNKPLRPNFWTRFPLKDFSHEEWEALCDGCAKCCLIKLEEEDTGEIAYTNISCRLLDQESCRCGNYDIRKLLVKGCVTLTPETLEDTIHWMPRTCAYRLLYEGKPLEAWHPLISGSADSVHAAGISLRGAMIAEYDVEEDDWPDYVLDEDVA